MKMKKYILLGLVMLGVVAGASQVSAANTITSISKGNYTEKIRVYFHSSDFLTLLPLMFYTQTNGSPTCTGTYWTGTTRDVSSVGNVSNNNYYADYIPSPSKAGERLGVRVAWTQTGGPYCSDTAYGYQGPPKAPTSLDASDGTYDNKVHLSWPRSATDPTGSYGDVYYKIERSPNLGNGYVTLASTASNSFDDTSAVAGTTYYYRVSATGDNTVSAYVTDTGSRKAAEVYYNINATANPSNGGTVSSRGTDYRYTTAPYPAGVQVVMTATPASGFTFDKWTGDLGGTTNTNTFNMLARTMNVIANFKAAALSALASNITPSNDRTDGINVTWTAPTGAKEFSLHRCPTANLSSCIILDTHGALTATSYLDTGMPVDTYYYYAVDVKNSAGVWVGRALSSTTGHRVATVSTCTFTYSAWGACSASGAQIRLVLSKSPAGCTGGSPETSRGCTPPGSRYYNVTYKVSPAGAGEIGGASSLGGTYSPMVSSTYGLDAGVPQYIKGLPASGYTFKNWAFSTGDTHPDNPYAFAPYQDLTITANFETTGPATCPPGTTGTPPNCVPIVPPTPSTCDATLFAPGWNPPGSTPPSGNADAPLNVSGKSQAKPGCLAIGKSSKPDSQLDVKGDAIISGALGLGTLNAGHVNATQSLSVNGIAITHDSDQRLKTVIAPLTTMLAKILQLKPVSFEWKDQSRGAGQKLGLIAQDVEQVFPQVVQTGTNGYKAVDYSALVAPLIKAVQEQQTEIDLLKQEIELLKLSH